MKIILQKFIAETGLYSRRRAEELIRLGRVTVNGMAAELGMRADENDDVRVSGKKIELQKKKIYIKLNKPPGYTCTNRKFPGEKNVFELLDDINRKNGLHVVGRLDKDSRGLALLTNDGSLTQRLTHPKFEHEKRYLVRISTDSERILTDHGSSGNRKSEIGNLEMKLKQGVDIGEGDGVVRARAAKYLGGEKFEIILTEGKKRQIRRMFRVLGREVADIERTAIGKLELGNLKEGEWRYLDNDQLSIFNDQ
jgi:23S rRNA pseudouridine2605 synthase